MVRPDKEQKLIVKQIIKHRAQLIKYGISGVIALSVEYTTFLLLILAMGDNGHILFAQTLSFFAGLISSFLGNRFFTFKTKDSDYAHSSHKQLSRYVVLAMFNLALTNLIIYALISGLTIPPFIAKALVMAMTISWNFVLFRRYIFKSK